MKCFIKYRWIFSENYVLCVVHTMSFRIHFLTSSILLWIDLNCYSKHMRIFVSKRNICFYVFKMMMFVSNHNSCKNGIKNWYLLSKKKHLTKKYSKNFISLPQRSIEKICQSQPDFVLSTFYFHFRLLHSALNYHRIFLSFLTSFLFLHFIARDLTDTIKLSGK